MTRKGLIQGKINKKRRSHDQRFFVPVGIFTDNYFLYQRAHDMHATGASAISASLVKSW